MENKNAYLANFNCTFGSNNEPLLEHFLNIVFPTFKVESDNSNIRKNFLIDNVKLSRIRGNFMLSGIIIKRTTLEVKSQFVDGHLTKIDNVYLSDPFSYFIINLANHRMILVKNQKGSPTLANFSRLSRQIIKDYTLKLNEHLSEDEKLPEAQLHVVAIPYQFKIYTELKKLGKLIQ